MIRSAKVARFRGIRDLVVDGLGRVNLVIGRNDCGKTALLEALQAAEDPKDGSHNLFGSQRERLNGSANVSDFERFWRPLFFNLDSSLGLNLSVCGTDGTWSELELRKGLKPDEVISSVEPPDESLGRDAYSGSENWALDVRSRIGGHESIKRVVAISSQLRMPPTTKLRGSTWIGSGAGISSHDIALVSQLKERGRDADLLELLRVADERISGIELLAPQGNRAQLFVRLENDVPLLPIAVMGDGFQRCVEFGAVAAINEWPTVFIDEIENGMHHNVLEPLWRWLAMVSSRRGIQIFATTHSEECIQAACRAFGALGDDGLRVVRLDRLGTGTRAVIYDRSMLETAARTGTEIRG